MTTLSWGTTPLHPERAHTVLPGTDVSICTRHLRDGQLLLDQITAHRPTPPADVPRVRHRHPGTPLSGAAVAAPTPGPRDSANPRLRQAGTPPTELNTLGDTHVVLLSRAQ